MTTVYANSEERATPQDTPRGVSYAKPITAAKEAVAVLELAERLVGKPLTRNGQGYKARCPLPDHTDKTPSFYVYADNERGWTCFGCHRGGDVVDLYAFAHSYDDMREAAGFLLLEFGHEPPQRPQSYFEKGKRQYRARVLMEDARLEALTRRLWRYVFAPIVGEIEDEDERVEMAKRLWAEVEDEARYMLVGRMKR